MNYHKADQVGLLLNQEDVFFDEQKRGFLGAGMNYF